ncbi:MAG: hypothetical protein ACFFA6_14840 [Promethearchaeota archaeon]
MLNEKAIGFDYSHNNKLIIESETFSDFIQYLFNSNFKLGKIEAGISYEKLMKYNIFIIGVPTMEPSLNPDEIDALVKYVNDGGSLLIINDKGGDYDNNNNLSELTKHFGIKFNSDRLFDDKNFSKKSSHPIIQEFTKHFITKEIAEIIHSSGCTLNIDKTVENEKIEVKAIAFSSEESSRHKYFNGNDWVEEPVNKIPIIGITHFGLGKAVALGNLSLFSSLQKSYGINAADNFKLVSNIISWLLNKAQSTEEQAYKPIYMTIPIEQDLYYWIKEMLDVGRWKNIDDVINFALRVVKIRMKEVEKNKEED